MQAKTERFEMRFDQGTLDEVDAWRARQEDLPSRAEAVRRLVEEGLAVGSGNPLRFGDGEKLTLFMLCEIYKHLKIKSEIDPAFLEAALGGGHYWGLGWKYPGIFHGHEDSQRVVNEVVKMLDMWDIIEISYRKLAKKDKDRIAKEAKPFGNDVKFRGFGGNRETEHMSVAMFLINDLDRFAAFKGRDINSHLPSIDAYRRMYRVFEPIRPSLVGATLTASQIIKFLQAMVHPDNRKTLKQDKK